MIHHPPLTATHSTGVRLQGNNIWCDRFLFSTESSTSTGNTSIVNLVNVSGTFQVGEKIIASDSAETSKLIERTSTGDDDADDLISN